MERFKTTGRVLTILAALGLSASVLAGGGCDQQGPAEEVGEGIDDTFEGIGDGIQNLGEGIEDAAR
jgi:hypothetical protein